MNGFHRVLLCIWMVCNHTHLCITSKPNKMRTKVMVYFKNILWATFFLIMSTRLRKRMKRKRRTRQQRDRAGCRSVRRGEIHSVENLFVVWWDEKCWTKWKYIIATRKTGNVWIFALLFPTLRTYRFIPFSLLSFDLSFVRSHFCCPNKMRHGESLANEFVIFQVVWVGIASWKRRAMVNLSCAILFTLLKLSHCCEMYNHNIASSNNVPT